jgi:hypothetical protein
MTWRALIVLWHILRGWGGLIVGAVYTIARGFKELLAITDELLYRHRDYAVFEIIDTPRVSPPMIRTRIAARGESLDAETK